MPVSGNGSSPEQTTAKVATELRRRLEGRLGRERTEEIWRDPSNVQKVLKDEDEAASVAGMMLQAWKELPEEESKDGRKRQGGFRRGLRLAIIAAMAVWAVSLLKKARQPGDEGSTD
jgi:hypothetical protein